MHLCVLCGSQNKQRLFLYTASIYWFLKPKQRVFTARGTKWVFKSDRYSFVLKGLIISLPSLSSSPLLLLLGAGVSFILSPHCIVLYHIWDVFTSYKRKDLLYGRPTIGSVIKSSKIYSMNVTVTSWRVRVTAFFYENATIRPLVAVFTYV